MPKVCAAFGRDRSVSGCHRAQMVELNRNLLDTGTPPIPEALAWLSAYDGALGSAISLSQAVPGDPPPVAFLQRIAEAAGSAEATRYGDIFGDEALRQAYASDVSSVYRASLEVENVAITAGCNQAFFVTVMALAKAGDAILLPSPWYFNHKMTLDMLGIEAIPFPLSPEEGFLPDLQAARELVSDRVRALVLVTPNNPTGAIYPDALLRDFASLCHEAGIALVVDETYRDFRTGGDAPHSLFGTPDWAETDISLYSFSKSYAIPGHRVGAIIGGGTIISEIGKILDCVQICPARAAQMALPWAIDNLRQWRAEAADEIAGRAAAFQVAMRQAPGWRIDQIGAYFAYIRHPFQGVSSTQVAEELARSCGVLALPGTYFGPGQEGHLRVAFANVGLDRIAELGKRFAALKSVAGVSAATIQEESA